MWTLGLAVAWAPSCARQAPPQTAIVGGTAARGADHIRAYGCGSCHTIPGISGARGLVGPPLWAMGDRTYIAGVIPNEPAEMIRWIQDPRAIDPLTAMPNLNVTTEDARDIAAYLLTLRSGSRAGTLGRWLAGVD
jgi:cytochrome c1